jgi:hypothetical protein
MNGDDIMDVELTKEELSGLLKELPRIIKKLSDDTLKFNRGSKDED